MPSFSGNQNTSVGTKLMGPLTEAADELHGSKYREPGENFRDFVNRISHALADDSRHYHRLREIFGGMFFSPGGRVQAAAGSARKVTYYNCFVSGPIEDSLFNPDSYCFNSENDDIFLSGGGIMQRFVESMATMRMGGGIGYDFSTLRPEKDPILSLMSQSSGPLSFMNIFNAGCNTIASAGHRRGAQMGVMRVDHPDIMKFVRAKHDQITLKGFNISVGLTDEFMECLEAGKEFQLKFNGKNYQKIDALELWETIMRSTWDWAEPGCLFIDRINQMNNLYYCETIAATNPCGEQPLPPYGACLLGSVNLTKYLTRQPVHVSLIQNKVGMTPMWALDLDHLLSDIPDIIRAMDNVVDKSIYPVPQQAREAKNKRRMGIGVMGLANALEAMGLPYGTPDFLAKQAEILRAINIACYKASAMLAKEKGKFPLYDEEKYLASKFIVSDAFDDDTRYLMKTFGMRNSHLTSIAPTGTISMSADNISSGIEPVFSYQTQRPINTPDGPVIKNINDYGVEFLGVQGRRSHEVTPEEHIAVLATAQRFVDSSVSKTCNLDGTVSWDRFKALYTNAYKMGCKGATTFNSDGKRMALLVARDAPEDRAAACQIDETTGRRECA